MLIQSRSNPLIKETRALASAKERRARNLHCIEGDKLVSDAIASGAALADVFLLEGTPPPASLPENVRLYTVTQSVLEAVTDSRTPQHIAATVHTPDSTPPERFPKGLVVLLDGVQDPGNVGAIIRSADAFGAKGVLLSPACADAFAPKTLRAAMGSTYHLPIWQGALLPALDTLTADGFTCVCGHLHGAETFPTLAKNAALVIGSEGGGVCDEVAARCIRYRLPMPGRAESLNASVAAGVLLYIIHCTLKGAS